MAAVKSAPAALSLPADSFAHKNIRPEYHEILIVGAGLSGIAMGCQLQRKLKTDDFLILDKAALPAGTWSINTYPGCGCDVPAAVYSFSFRQKADWSTFYPLQEELKEYFNTVVAEYDLPRRMHLSTEVKEARFDVATGLWHVWSIDLATKEEHHYVSKVFVSAVGGLSQPNDCDIPGHETFAGPLFHSARWDHSVDLKDKHVVVVGNGCSATQFMPIIAKDCKSLTQFVRAKHWMMPVTHNPLEYIPGWKWLVRHIGFFRALNRFLIWLVLENHFTITKLNVFGRIFRWYWARQCTWNVKAHAPKEYWPLLLATQEEMLVGCKRRVITDTYMPSLRRNNVHLEGSKLTKIEPNACITADGRKLPADVIIMANGFATQRAGFPMSLYNSKGEEIREHWNKYGAGGPLSYRSTMNSGFPNYFTIVGTNSATGHMSLIFTSECQVDFTLELIKPILKAPRPSEAALVHLPTQPANGLKSIPTVECKLQAEKDEQKWITKKMQNLVFSTGCGAWYVDKTSQRVTAMHPDWQWKFMLRSEIPNWADLEYKHLPGGAKLPNTIPYYKRFANKVLGFGTIPIPKDSEMPAGFRWEKAE
ncbi:FAD/NAD(P)-binding domain-containing protein [Ceraceosorus guamensis]|uniref:FAD/NAD(P)-binding domain-containing protein n=1 Tax=Ceraceosorus guamensis TaxID=1522189 RepID=A0A316W7C9_9BASI|nr:FAD/NAD(P)-binding domain-containing protein [Ceraceosorus guamensis]PWN45759.1 FAD/NAD(P)-binding domain-containing protein [Ceraceosorus guamensis]